MRRAFIVKASSGEPYEVAFERIGSQVRATCTCQAGMSRQACKHRFAMMDGDLSMLISDNHADLAALPAMLAGTELLDAYAKLLAALATQERAARDVAAAKKALSRIMHL